ncbi:MAG: type II toxin-antitoxin system RelE/ParE family toxin [Pseudomonadales bacterium]
MTPYQLTKDAENDLREVARYTLNKWGKEMLQEYRSGLKNTFKKIGNNDVRKRQFSKEFPALLVTKYRYHFIFYLSENFEKPTIVGVIHERRDIVNRLAERLS